MRIRNLAVFAILAARTLQAQTWTISARPTMSIGSEEATPEYQFDRITHVRRLSDGRILVTMGPDIRYFDAKGKYLAKAGGRGQGPGEFQFIQDLVVLPGDTLMILNFRNKVWLTADGKFIRQELMQLGPLSADGWFAEGSTLLPNGNLLAQQYRSESVEPPPAELHRPKIRYAMLDLKKGALTPLVLAGGIRQITSRGGGGGVQPFSPHAQHAVSNDRFYVGDNDEAFVTVYGFDGIRQRTITINDRRVRVTPELLDAYKKATLEFIGTDAARRERFERSWTEVPKPAFYPYWSTLLTDKAGNLWASSYPTVRSAPVTWTVFDPTGRRLTTLQLPANFTPKDIGNDYIIGVVRDDLGIEAVRMHSLVKR